MTDEPEILEFLRSVELFSALDEDGLRRLAGSMELRSCEAGEVLFREGDPGNDLFILKSGELGVFVQRGRGRQRRIGAVKPAQCVGEMGLFFAGTRLATVAAEEAAELLQLGRNAFQDLLTSNPSLRSVFGKIIEQRLPRLRVVLTELFGNIDDEVFRDIEQNLRWHRLQRGDTLFQQGDIGNELYLLVHGRLQVYSGAGAGGEAPQVIGELGRGEWVGEMSLIDDLPRSATVMALRDTDLLALDRSGFYKVVAKHPEVLWPIVRTMSRRLRSANVSAFTTITPPTTLAVAVVPLTPLPRYFLDVLHDQLSKDGKVIVLSEEAFDDMHGQGAARTPHSDPRSTYLSSWLSQLEDDHRYVIYVANGDPTEWTRRCLRHADRVLFSLESSATAAMDRASTWKQLRQTSKLEGEVMLWHESGMSELPLNTEQITAPFGAGKHHHLRIGNIHDIERLGRFLTNRSIGLVLSGGGARGFAHIGVYKALVERGVPIDRVGGTSMGAFIAAMIASQMEVEEVIDITRRIFVTKPRGFGYTLPLMSLLQVNAAEQAIKGFLKGRDIEDTWIPFFCCATNLSNSELKVFTSGPMWQALRATTAVPGLCPPVFFKGDVLVDGAVLDNVPVDIMASAQPGPIIASDVTKARAFKVDPVLETPPNTARLLWQRLTGSKEYGELPSMGAILTRSLDCSSRLRRKTNVQQASMYITPPVGDFALLDMDSIDRLVAAGYEHTCRELDSTDMASILEYEFNPNDPVALADTSD